MQEDAHTGNHSLRELFNGLRWFVRAGCLRVDDCPTICRGRRCNSRRNAGCAQVAEALAEDLRLVLRVVARPGTDASAVILRSIHTRAAGGRALTRTQNARLQKLHATAVDTLGNLLALKVTAANEQDRAQVRAGPSRTSYGPRISNWLC